VLYQNIRISLFGFVTKQTDRQMDGQTDGWTELRLSRPG